MRAGRSPRPGRCSPTPGMSMDLGRGRGPRLTSCTWGGAIFLISQPSPYKEREGRKSCETSCGTRVPTPLHAV